MNGPAAVFGYARPNWIHGFLEAFLIRKFERTTRATRN